MSGEIKYRAWDKTTKSMIKDYAESAANGELYVAQFQCSPPSSPRLLDLILMKCTGIKDKNGKKSYHKDIVRMSIFIYTIEWCDKSARFYLKSNIAANTLKYTMTHLPKNGEIIGSVYENPDYLTPETIYIENKLGAQ